MLTRCRVGSRMKAYLAVTDRDGYRFLHARPDLDKADHVPA